MTAAPADGQAAERLHPVLLHHIVNTLGWRQLRELQEAAVEPLLAGDDAVLLAATASGKTEAAVFPLLSRMASEQWAGLSVLYICPLKALLNNLEPRLASYGSWLGRRVAVWHGDVTAPTRKAILRDRPDLLLTTPESIEAMLVSVNVDHDRFFADLRAVVVDEVHAFAGDDRGWHLLAVLERLGHAIGRPLQRIGLSATVGNPAQLLDWLQGAAAGRRPGRVVAPHLDPPAPGSAVPAATTPGTAVPPGEIELDYVGSLTNAATVIAALHSGEKRLVFCESRQDVEQLGQLLRVKGVSTFLSHASLSLDERRRAEQAFAEARDCVIVSTSTLELGVDVGDLDRVVQIGAPRSVASLLQRLGRTGRRPGTTRNCLFLAPDRPSLLRAAGLLLLWGRGWVEPVIPPPEPRHIVAQQILALCLQERQVGGQVWPEWWNGLEPFTGNAADVILRYLVDEGYLQRDGDMLFIGPEAELRFGHRHFTGMTAVFTAPPEFTVLAGRTELGRIDPSLLTEQVPGPRRLLLGGRSWQVSYVDWHRRRCFVEPVDSGGKARWTSAGVAGLSYELSRAMRAVVLGAEPPVAITRRATDQLGELREQHLPAAHPGGTVVTRLASGDVRWWTWAGFRANATLTSTLAGLTDPVQDQTDLYLRLRRDLTPAQWRSGIADSADRLCLPEVDEKALTGLKFNSALPQRVALATLATRLADLPAALEVLREPSRFVVT
ncbi:DEAD/DEAH box helicase [Micromonospora sp. WMMD1102]|uniref:DEAD/DEAH box helicase n=1 Tax=Micromonospora sp. WMMD1102 TaxID=3016105 RepID=UPI0024158883|nr:DEAD/DEAH box helicase [Micromonospora sp. WMMD1102]MDG4791859.1 DEAD/DEAH box helicase [Micromonospora sp. WMMD1102]